MISRYINLTAGIEALNKIPTDFRYVFIRLQSTACEQKRFDEIILTISDDLLIHAALGFKCLVYDYSHANHPPRALWQGLEWVRYCLNMRWYGMDEKPEDERSKKCLEDFRRRYKALSKRAKARLDYFKKFVTAPGPVSIEYEWAQTIYDGKYEYYKNLLKAQVKT